ncbi:MAG: hypothetical protein ACI9HB_002310, partial [Gammaproteobacteria bacterium]
KPTSLAIPNQLSPILQTRFNLVGHERQETRNPTKKAWHTHCVIRGWAENSNLAQENLDFTALGKPLLHNAQTPILRVPANWVNVRFEPIRTFGKRRILAITGPSDAG